MAYVNFDTKEIHTKVLCFGPAGSGKIETLKSIFRQTSEEVKDGVMELGQSKQNASFSFLPVSVGYVKDFHVKMHLFVPPVSSKLYDTVETVLFNGVDGLLFVLDARMKAMDQNLVSMREIEKKINSSALQENELSYLIQYNHMNESTALSLEDLDKQLNPKGFVSVQTNAARDAGTLQVLEEMSKMLVRKVVN